MKLRFSIVLILFAVFCFSQQKKVVSFTDINYKEGIAYSSKGEKLNGAVSRNRTFGPYYDSKEKTFIFKDGILISEVSYFTTVPENIAAKEIFYYPNTTQISKMTIFQDKKHKVIKTYEFYDNGKRKSIETVQEGKVRYNKTFENK